jgi:hypothetical protein
VTTPSPLFHLRLASLLQPSLVFGAGGPRLAAPPGLLLGPLPLISGGLLGLSPPVVSGYRFLGGFLLAPGEDPRPILPLPSPALWLRALVSLLVPPLLCPPFASFSEPPAAPSFASPGRPCSNSLPS